MTLIDLYRSGGALLSGHQVLRDFDLVVANSGGSVVLGGLIKDLPLVDIQKYFEDPELRHALFPRASRSLGARIFGRIAGIGPRYSTQKKLDGLRRILNGAPGDPGIGDLTVDALKTRTRLPTQIMIAAFDYDRQREIFFRSNIKSRAADFAMPPIATLAEAIHASTTAPLGFFDAPAAVSRGRRCWDGAIGGQHNPISRRGCRSLGQRRRPRGDPGAEHRRRQPRPCRSPPATRMRRRRSSSSSAPRRTARATSGSWSMSCSTIPSTMRRCWRISRSASRCLEIPGTRSPKAPSSG